MELKQLKQRKKSWKPFLLALLVGAGACASNQPIPALSPEELIQRGQEAADRNRYKQALRYYEALLEQHPSVIDQVCAAEYEIAFIHYKQKNYPLAREELERLKARYTGAEAVWLPQEYRILADLVLKQIEQKTVPPQGPAE